MKLMGKKSEEEEVTSLMKDIRIKERGPGSVRTELFPAPASEKELAMMLHGEVNSEGHVNSTMQAPLGTPVAMEEEEKDKVPHKFKRAKRNEQKSEAAKSPCEKLKKKRSGDDLMEIEPAETKDAKKAKCGNVDGVEKQAATNEAGLLKQPCVSQ